MSTHTNNMTLRASAILSSSGGGTTYGDAVSVDKFNEILLFFRVTVQGTYTDETLTVTVQTKDQAGNYYDLEDSAFTAIGDKTSAVPYAEYMALLVFGSTIRLKYVTTGTTQAYTFGVTGLGKGEY